MTTLALDTPRQYVPEGTDVEEFPVIAADIIYEGAAVGDNGSGYARPLVAGDPFRGFALAKVDNAAGSAGDKVVRVRKHGVIQLSISALAITDVGKDVYASDDGAFTLTEGANTRIGSVQRWDSTGVGLVAFGVTDGQQTELTDSSGGTANTTIEAVPAAGGSGATTAQEAAINNNFADLAAAVNSIIRRLGN